MVSVNEIPQFDNTCPDFKAAVYPCEWSSMTHLKASLSCGFCAAADKVNIYHLFHFTKLMFQFCGSLHSYQLLGGKG